MSKKNTIVYVVESGYYSDKCVIGVYSTRIMADRIARFVKDASVSEFAVDCCNATEQKIANGYLPFYVRMLRDGTLQSCRTVPLQGNFNPNKTKFRGAAEFQSWQWAKSEKAAVKIANDRRAMAIAAEDAR